MAFGERAAERLAHLAGKWAFILSLLAMRRLERRVLDVLRRPAQDARDAQAQQRERMRHGERTAGRPGHSASRWTFMVSLLAVSAAWITLLAPRRPSGAGGHAGPGQARGAR
jgi:uncharacterized membrane protein